MKQMSQESMFSDVQLENPDGRRNSNAGPFSVGTLFKNVFIFIPAHIQTQLLVYLLPDTFFFFFVQLLQAT